MNIECNRYLSPWQVIDDAGGSYDAAAVARSMATQGSDAHRTGAAGAWRDAFLRMPYWRDPGVGLGPIMDTFETAITWVVPANAFVPGRPCALFHFGSTWQRRRQHGGTSTHHHAVGRDHRSGYEREVPALFRQMLVAAKGVADPQGIMNPGVLIDPAGRSVGLAHPRMLPRRLSGWSVVPRPSQVK